MKAALKPKSRVVCRKLHTHAHQAIPALLVEPKKSGTVKHNGTAKIMAHNVSCGDQLQALAACGRTKYRWLVDLQAAAQNEWPAVTIACLQAPDDQRLPTTARNPPLDALCAPGSAQGTQDSDMPCWNRTEGMPASVEVVRGCNSCRRWLRLPAVASANAAE